MDRALPLNVREKNLLQIKEAIINESYKTTSEIVDGCKTAIGFLFEDFSIKGCEFYYAENRWSPLYSNASRTINKASIIKIGFNLEIKQETKYYLKFFSRRQLSANILKTDNLSRSIISYNICYIINSLISRTIAPAEVLLTSANYDESYHMLFTMPIIEYPELEKNISQYKELSLKKQEIIKEAIDFEELFVVNNLSAALISNVKYCNLKYRFSKITNLINKIYEERAKVVDEMNELQKSIINDYIKDDVQAIKSKLTEEDSSNLLLLQKNLFSTVF
jgi:hypothetical protein